MLKRCYQRFGRISTVIVLLLTTFLVPVPIYAQNGGQTGTKTDIDTIIAQAKQQLLDGQAQAAYELLAQYEAEHSGNPKFDYHLGKAALAAKHPAEAVFALERALVVRPDFLQARAELGRAYFYLGENKSAEAEFQTVKQADVPQNVSANLDKFLSAIQSRFDSSGSRLNYYVALEAGSDSNVNSATDSSQIAIPRFGGLVFDLSEDGRELDSTIFSLESGIGYSKPLSNSLNFYTAGDITLREVNDASEFSTRITNALAGIHKLAGSSQYRLALALQDYAVDSEAFRRQFGLNAEWQKMLNTRNQLTLYIQYADLAYPDLEFRDGDQTTLGFAWGHSFRRGILFAGVFFGDESVDDATSQQFARDFTGIRLGLRYSVGRNTLYSNINMQSSEYDGADPLFSTASSQTLRDDDYINLTVGYRIPLYTGKWTLTPELSVTQNDSNIAIYEYDRNVISVTARYDF